MASDGAEGWDWAKAYMDKLRTFSCKTGIQEMHRVQEFANESTANYVKYRCRDHGLEI